MNRHEADPAQVDVDRRPSLSIGVRAVVLVMSLASLFVAGWALFAAPSFYRVLAPYPPYNAHFLHDIGAFNGALAAIGLLAVGRRTALVAASTGLAVGAVLHAASHLIDRHQGGHSADVITFALIAAVATLAAVVAARNGECMK